MVSSLCKLAAACLLICVVLTASVNAAAPKLINYQGRLTSGGNSVDDGVYTVRFRVYTDSTGGTSLWEETLPVQTKGGLFAVALGGSSSLPDTLFSSPNRFLGIKVNLDTEITPRSRLVSTPYALETAQWTTRGNAIVRSGGVGIGTSAPIRKFEVNDTTAAVHVARFGSNSADAATIELHNTTNNSTWLLGSTGSVGAWSGVVPSKSFYLLRWTAPIPAFIADSLNRVWMSYWPDPSTGYTRLNVGAEYDTEVTRAIYGRGTYEGVVGVATLAGAWAVGGITYSNSVSAIGVYGYAENGRAGAFAGNVEVAGTLSKSAGSFRVDHPLDPENKYLSHSFVESPDMMNIYNGNVTTDVSGDATVTLPDWFGALNKDFRYQLTVIGQFAQAIVSSEIANNQFSIRSDKPNVKVSWQITGIRQDAYANAHRIPVEEDKPDIERGHYQHPELFGQPEEKGIEWARHPEMMKQRKAERLKLMTADGR